MKTIVTTIQDLDEVPATHVLVRFFADGNAVIADRGPDGWFVEAWGSANRIQDLHAFIAGDRRSPIVVVPREEAVALDAVRRELRPAAPQPAFRSDRGRLLRAETGEADLWTLLKVGAVAAVLALVGFLVAAPYTNVRTVECTVIEKDRVSRSSSSSDMRVYTEQCGTLHVKDLWLIGLTDSADLYGAIEPDGTYLMDVGGYRVSLLSWFPAVHAATEVAS